MIASFHYKNKTYRADLSKPLDISIPLRAAEAQVNCFYAPFFELAPVRAGSFVGSTKAGGPVNFYNLHLNPHGNGTHTECAGHIARPADFGTDSEFVFTINQCLRKFHFMAKLASIYPTKQPNGDRVILPVQIEGILQPGETEALILRTMPNDASKCSRSYSGANPPYIHHEAIEHMVACGVEHLLIDLPSVDREMDEGKLLSHRAFWQYPEDFGQSGADGGKSVPAEGRVGDFGRKNCTITELIYVDNEIQDGLYLLNLQTASLETDASPSKPVLFRVRERN